MGTVAHPALCLPQKWLRPTLLPSPPLVPTYDLLSAQATRLSNGCMMQRQGCFSADAAVFWDSATMYSKYILYSVKSIPDLIEQLEQLAGTAVSNQVAYANLVGGAPSLDRLQDPPCALHCSKQHSAKSFCIRPCTLVTSVNKGVPCAELHLFTGVPRPEPSHQPHHYWPCSEIGVP